MAKFEPLTDEDFERKGGDYFDVGVYEVVIADAKRVDPENGSPFASFDVEGESGQKANTRYYLSPAAAKYSVQKMATIAVHNKTSESDKQAVRDAFKKIDDDKLIDNGFLKKFIDMQAWIRVEEDTNAPKPNGGFYKRTELFGYEPKPKAPSAVQTMLEDSDPVDPSEIPF